MDTKREIDYRLAKWIFANLHHEGKIDKKIYHQLVDRLPEEYQPPTKCIEERWEVSEDD